MCCVALPRCLFDLACFFLHSFPHLSLKHVHNMYCGMYMSPQLLEMSHSCCMFADEAWYSPKFNASYTLGDINTISHLPLPPWMGIISHTHWLHPQIEPPYYSITLVFPPSLNSWKKPCTPYYYTSWETLSYSVTCMSCVCVCVCVCVCAQDCCQQPEWCAYACSRHRHWWVAPPSFSTPHSPHV